MKGREASLENIAQPTAEVVREFQALCESALLGWLRSAPIPAPAANPPGTRPYGEAPTALVPQPRNTHDGYGHISFTDPSRCVVRAIGAYLVRPGTPPRRAVCPSDRGPFDPSFGEPLP